MQFQFGDFVQGLSQGIAQSREKKKNEEERKLRERIAKDQESLRVAQEQEVRARTEERVRKGEGEKRQEGQRERLRDVVRGGDMGSDATFAGAGVEAPTQAGRSAFEGARGNAIRSEMIGLDPDEIRQLAPALGLQAPQPPPPPMDPTMKALLEAQMARYAPGAGQDPTGAAPPALRFNIGPKGPSVGSYAPEAPPKGPSSVGMAGLLQEEMARQNALQPGESKDPRVRAFARLQQMQVGQAGDVAAAQTGARLGTAATPQNLANQQATASVKAEASARGSMAGSPISAEASKDIGMLNQIVSDADTAIRLFDPDVIGPFAAIAQTAKENFGETPVLGRLLGGPPTSDQITLAQSISRVRNVIRNKQYGATLTQFEKAAAETELTALEKSPTSAKQRLINLRDIFAKAAERQTQYATTPRGDLGQGAPKNPGLPPNWSPVR